MNNKELQEQKYADSQKDYFFDKEDFFVLEKFHQKTTWNLPFDWTFSNEVLDWESKVEYKDVLPETSELSIDMSIKKAIKEYKEPRSTRKYNKDYQISKEIFSEILFESFGRFKGMGSKNYPSAGGLYPVIPIVFVLSPKSIEGIEIPGVYIYDSSNLKLLLIKNLKKKRDMEMILNNINSIKPGFALSNISIGYVLDIEKTYAKYKTRGYRHGLIEVGLMVENFINAYRKLAPELGDCVWSGFNDNALAHACGLNIRKAPIIMTQWIGKKI